MTAGNDISTPRPIFVVGSLRSGASLLTLSLAQHPNIAHALETRWFERFGVGLQHAYELGIRPRETSQLDVDAIELEQFFAHFGRSIDDLILGKPRALATATGRTAPDRWVDGTQANSHDLFTLLRLFPDAKAIHILRDAAEVVASLSTIENRSVYKTRQIMMRTDEAVEHWRQAVTACVDAEKTFGSATVLRVQRRDLVAEPERVLRRCLEFIGEPCDPGCLRAFRPLTWEEPDQGSVRLPVVDLVAPVPDEVATLSDEFLAETDIDYPRDELAILRKEMDAGRLIEWELRAFKSARQREARALVPKVTAVETLRGWAAYRHAISRRFRTSRRPGINEQ